MSKHNNRHFGGIAILINPLLKPHVKILKNTYHDYQWIVLDKKFFNLTDKERLVSELTRSDCRGLNTYWNSLCVYSVGRKARSSDCIDTVLSVFKFIINIGCL